MSQVPATASSTVVQNCMTCTGAKRLCSEALSCPVQASARPLYCLEFFKEQIRNDRWGIFNTRRTERSLDTLDWDYNTLRILLLNLQTFSFQKTVSNCTVNDLDGYEELDSDQYCVCWDEDNSVSVREISKATVILSLKIAVIEDSEGVLSGVVTFHPSN